MCTSLWLFFSDKVFQFVLNELLSTCLEQNFTPSSNPVLLLSSSQGTFQPTALRLEWNIVIISPPLFIPIQLKYRLCTGRWNSVNLSGIIWHGNLAEFLKCIWWILHRWIPRTGNFIPPVSVYPTCLTHIHKHTYSDTLGRAVEVVEL